MGALARSRSPWYGAHSRRAVRDTCWHRKHAVRVLQAEDKPVIDPKPRELHYGAPISDALVALWEASDLWLRENRVNFATFVCTAPLLLANIFGQSRS